MTRGTMTPAGGQKLRQAPSLIPIWITRLGQQLPRLLDIVRDRLDLQCIIHDPRHDDPGRRAEIEAGPLADSDLDNPPRPAASSPSRHRTGSARPAMHNP